MCLKEKKENKIKILTIFVWFLLTTVDQHPTILDSVSGLYARKWFVYIWGELRGVGGCMRVLVLLVVVCRGGVIVGGCITIFILIDPFGRH